MSDPEFNLTRRIVQGALILFAAVMLLLYAWGSLYLWKKPEEVPPAITSLWLMLPFSLIGAGAALSLPDIFLNSERKDWPVAETLIYMGLAFGILTACAGITHFELDKLDFAAALAGYELEHALVFGLWLANVFLLVPIHLFAGCRLAFVCIRTWINARPCATSRKLQPTFRSAYPSLPRQRVRRR